MTNHQNNNVTRRAFIGHTGIGVAALASLLDPKLLANDQSVPHFAPTAKRVIFLHQTGAPSQLDLYDVKPELSRWHGQELPQSVRGGQRLTTLTAGQASLPVTASPFKFARHGESGTALSELLPHTSRVVDDLCIVRSMHTEAINHDPACTMIQTGAEQPGRPSIGSWVSYGLGSESQELPAFVVLLSGGLPGDQPLSSRWWGSGFLPSQHQAVKFRKRGEPVLYLNNPAGITPEIRRRMLDSLGELNRIQSAATGDAEIDARIAQFELAYRMQESLPRIADLTEEPEHTFALYGEDARQPGTYAANCLLARRLVEQGVRFIQLYDRDWDHHTDIVSQIKVKCRETDQASAALVQDLKQRGLLKDTLIVWAGEFGRTVFCEGELAKRDYGRDHHPRCFSIWLAGGGIRPGLTYGKTDEFSYNIAENPVHIHDLQATILRCLGIDHERLTYRYQGRDHRLTDIGGRVVERLL
ncbi:MAG: DUF1501 domain-containing protein [Planctomycetales bacterium]|nr:DUF1501 domain-containing protein [Planctomycetales bacterium]